MERLQSEQPVQRPLTGSGSRQQGQRADAAALHCQNPHSAEVSPAGMLFSIQKVNPPAL
jgi:hypothetical protein